MSFLNVLSKTLSKLITLISNDIQWQRIKIRFDKGSRVSERY